MTLAIPKELHEKMKKHKEIKWTEIARQAIEKKIAEMKLEKDPLRYYTLKRLAEEGEDADDLFES